MQILLKLKNGNKEELTMEEARELYNELHQIFGTYGGINIPVWGSPNARTVISDRTPPQPLDMTNIGPDESVPTWQS